MDMMRHGWSVSLGLRYPRSELKFDFISIGLRLKSLEADMRGIDGEMKN